jgi:putative transposase
VRFPRNPQGGRLLRGAEVLHVRRFDAELIEWVFVGKVDTIHFNPVKHGLVKKAKDWQWSSFHRYEQEGYYGAGWGRASEYWGEGKFGE